MSKTTCPECKSSMEEGSLIWVSDRYGNPYRKVCVTCVPSVEADISEWVFDPADAGEFLEPEDY